MECIYDARRLADGGSQTSTMDTTRATSDSQQVPDSEVSTRVCYSSELAAFLKRSKAKNYRALFDITLWGWGRIAGAVAFFTIFPNPLAYVVAIFFISSGMGILVALSHESQHSALLRNKRWNDLVGAWLCAYPVGSVYGASRAVHLAHHKHLNTYLDPDRHFHVENDKSTPEQFVTYFLRLLMGGQLWTSIVVNGFLRKQGSSQHGSEPQSSKQRVSAQRTLEQGSFEQRSLEQGTLEQGTLEQGTLEQEASELSALSREQKIPEVANLVPVQAVIFATLWMVTGYWWAYFALWLVPIFTLGTFFGYLRGFIDHARLESDDPNLAAGRLISVPNPSILDRALLTGLDFHYHAEHHFFPSVPHYYLPELHRVLQNDPGFRDRYLVRPTYFSFLRNYWTQIKNNAH